MPARRQEPFQFYEHPKFLAQRLNKLEKRQDAFVFWSFFGWGLVVLYYLISFVVSFL